MEIKTRWAQDRSGNVLPFASVSLFYEGTTDLVSGLEDSDGNPLSNPFQADVNGKAVFAAPDGQYDIEFSAGPRESRAAIQFLDVSGALQVVENIDTLRSITGNDGRDYLTVKFHSAEGDSGGGDFYWASGEVPGTYVDNGGTIIVPTGGDGSAAWVREFSGAVNPLWFGAVGDGVADDTAAFQAAGDFSKSIYVPAGVVVGITKVTFSGGMRFYGPGTIKWLTPSTDNMFVLNDAVNVTFDGVEVDVNNADAEQDVFYIIMFTGVGTENFTVQNCKFNNCYRSMFTRHATNSLLNINYTLHNNVFDAGTTARHNTHFSAGLSQMYGCQITNNRFYNMAMVAVTVSAAHTPPGEYDYPGDFIISGNIARGFYPNEIGIDPQQSMILIRSTTSGGSVRKSKMVISNNIIEGGKKAISFAEADDQVFDSVVINGNVCKNNVNGGISVGRNNVNQNLSTIVVSNNSIYLDADYLNDVSPGQAGAQVRLISLEGPNILCDGNYVENAPEAGIYSMGNNVMISNNVIVNCGISSAFATWPSGYGGGIRLQGGAFVSVKNNKIYGGGYSDLDTQYAHGIAVNNTASITDFDISGNYIKNVGDKLVSGISLCRFSSQTPPSNGVVVGNTLVGFESRGSIIPRSADENANYHVIRDNPGWGEVETDWNPGTVAAGATETIVVPMKDCIIGDIVYVEFAGLRLEAVGDLSKWAIAGKVTTSSYYWIGTAGAVTIYLTNNTGADQTFSLERSLKVWIERRNKA